MRSSNKTWSTGGGNGKPLQYSCHKNSMNSMKRQKDMTPEDEPPRLEGVQYATEEEGRAITNSSRRNEEAGPKWKQCSTVDASGGEIKVRHCKEQYSMGTRNVRSMNQGKLYVVKKEMPWRRKWQPTPVYWPGESHKQRSVVGCSPWGNKESETTELLITRRRWQE